MSTLSFGGKPPASSRAEHTQVKAIIGGSLAAIGGLAGATQTFAREFGQQQALGSHFNGLYPPWRILTWAVHWHSQLPEAFMRAGSVGLTITGVGFFAIYLLMMVAENTARPEAFLHGSARWAGLEDIQAAGLLENDGVYVGAWVEPRRWWRRERVRYLRHSGPEHVLCYAPTRSGKGVGLVIPTLLSWPHSAVVTDLKGELWALTAGWRQQHARNKVLRFEPASASSCIGFNPLDEIRVGTEYEVGDVQNLATLLVDPDGRGLNDHWQKTAQALLVGCILHVLHKRIHEGTPANLAEVDAILADPDRSVADLWVEMVEYVHGNGQRHPIIGKYGRDMIDTPAKEAGSKVSTAKSYLSLYRDPGHRAKHLRVRIPHRRPDECR